VNELAARKDLIPSASVSRFPHAGQHPGARYARARGQARYTPSAGIAELREAAARYMGAMRIVDPARDVVSAAGRSLHRLYDPLDPLRRGDEVIYPTRGFHLRSQIVATARCRFRCTFARRATSVRPAELESKIQKTSS